jgi:para-nitrobenzyl esterase
MNRRELLQGTVALSALSALTGCKGRARNSSIAQTTLGKVRGSTSEDILSFKGIPYGADTATARFEKARSARAWTGIRDALSYGPMAPQPHRADNGGRKLLTSWHIPQLMSEDCLVLNVWTPDLEPRANRPVLVWIHGGSFFAGSGASNAYDGTRLATRGDAVVVTLNHRLNVFGYLYLAGLNPDSYADSGNVGQHDLIAALRWIQDNIHAFGGDPRNVTVFGESGGGQKICCLLAMEAARGLFHKAIIQSGPYLQANTLQTATDTGRIARQHLGDKKIENLTTADILSAYRKLPPDRVIGLGPVIDGRGLKRDPYLADAPATSLDIPILIGFTRTETTYMLGTDSNFTLDRDGLLARIRELAPTIDAAKLVSRYEELMPGASPSDLFFDITTHIIIGRDSSLIADRQSAKATAPVYFYHLGWSTPVDGGRWQSPHTLDVPLVFDNVSRVPSTFGARTDEAQRIADLMSNAWLSFARTGSPRTQALSNWLPYDPKQRKVMRIDTQCSLLTDPFRSRHELLANIPAWNGRSATR